MANLLDDTYNLLERCDKSTPDLAEASGVNRHWLEKFRQRKYEDPRIQSVQRLHNYLSVAQETGH